MLLVHWSLRRRDVRRTVTQAAASTVGPIVRTAGARDSTSAPIAEAKRCSANQGLSNEGNSILIMVEAPLRGSKTQLSDLESEASALRHRSDFPARIVPTRAVISVTRCRIRYISVQNRASDSCINSHRGSKSGPSAFEADVVTTGPWLQFLGCNSLGEPSMVTARPLVRMIKELSLSSAVLVPEWSEGPDSRSGRRNSAWVQIPSCAHCFFLCISQQSSS